MLVSLFCVHGVACVFCFHDLACDHDCSIHQASAGRTPKRSRNNMASCDTGHTTRRYGSPNCFLSLSSLDCRVFIILPFCLFVRSRGTDPGKVFVLNLANVMSSLLCYQLTYSKALLCFHCLDLISIVSLF